VVCVGIGVLSSASFGQTCVEQRRVTDPQPSLQALFGTALALEGDTLVVGAAGDDTFGVAVGSASVFSRDPSGDWLFDEKLVGSGVFQLDGLGLGVALEGDLLVVSGQGFGPLDVQGSAYVFRRDPAGNWIEEARIVDVLSQFSTWGSRVEICDGRIFIGNPAGGNGGVPGDPIGNIDVFEEVAPGVWEVFDRIAPRVDAIDRAGGFGEQFSCLGDQLLVGAPSSDIDTFGSKGAAFLFERRSDGVWRQTEEFFFEEGPASLLASYGSDVLLREDRLFISDAFRLGDTFEPGRLYVYDLQSDGSWELVQAFEGSRGQNNDRFGTALAEEDGLLLVGSPFHDLGTKEVSGVVYGLEHDGQEWVERGALRLADANAFDQLGVSIDVDGGTIAVGANFDDADTQVDSGAVHLFTFVPCEP